MFEILGILFIIAMILMFIGTWGQIYIAEKLLLRVLRKSRLEAAAESAEQHAAANIEKNGAQKSEIKARDNAATSQDITK